MVKIFVEPERKGWAFPEDLLCEKSTFFKAAFKGGFCESKDKVLEPPEDDSKVFGYVIDYVLQWRPPSSHMFEYFSNDDEVLQLALCKAYILVDKLGRVHNAESIRKSYLDYMWLEEHANEFPQRIVSPAAAKFLYENTTDSATMRKTVVHISTAFYYSLICATAETLPKWSKSAMSHSQFHFDVLVAVQKDTEIHGRRRKPEDFTCTLEGCVFHKE
jgi:hypothetical protein